MKTAKSAQEYLIGTLTVYMTPAAAKRWNAGETTAHDLANSLVCVPTSSRGLPCHDEISLRAALADKELSQYFEGCSAVAR